VTADVPEVNVLGADPMLEPLDVVKADEAAFVPPVLIPETPVNTVPVVIDDGLTAVVPGR
jgi:hypothetical protein